MAWFYLIFAGCFEVFGVVMMKKLVISGKKLYMVLMLCFMLVSFGLLSLAMQNISMSVAYAIWTGIGACGGVIAGILFFNESKSLAKLFFISLIIASSIGLKLLG